MVLKIIQKKSTPITLSSKKNEKTEILKRRAMHDTYAELSSKTTTQ